MNIDSLNQPLFNFFLDPMFNISVISSTASIDGVGFNFTFTNADHVLKHNFQNKTTFVTLQQNSP